MRKKHINLFIATLCFVFILMGTSQLEATPVTYLFDETLWGSSVGNGTFTLDVGDSLGTYHASSFSGGTSSFGAWTDVYFTAIVGNLPSLTFKNGPYGQVGYLSDAIGGGYVLSGSEADLEWANFIVYWSRNGVSITPVSGVPIPAAIWLLGSGLIGLAGLMRKFKK